jgi:hypothetical protein
MNSRLLAALTAGLLTLASEPRYARACGSAPPTYWTLVDASPAPGELVPTDGAIVIAGKSWIAGAGGGLGGLMKVTVFHDLGVEVPGSLAEWYVASGPAVVWRPDAALLPNTRFEMMASVESMAAPPAGVTGAPILNAGFSTGSGAAPALRLAGEMQVAFETYDQPLQTGCNDCGTGCTAAGSLRSLRARVTLPAVEGGYTPDAYAAWLWLTNDQPHPLPDGPSTSMVNLGGLERLVPGQATEVVREVPPEGIPYAPCFSLQVLDPSGHHVDAAPLCLPRMDVAATIRQLDAKSSPFGPAPVTSAGSGGTGGCAVGQAREPRAAVIVVSALLVAFAAGSRRRRARS